MKRIICYIVTLSMVCCMLFAGMTASAAPNAEKETQARSIAIVFDNSGSMYSGNNAKAWCQATYAIEVFATMLNEKDTLSVYPMHEIQIDGNSYSMENPVTITGPKNASLVRKMITIRPRTTPIEAIDAAHTGLVNASGEKWLIVLTDGDSFYENGSDLGGNTTRKLDERLGKYNEDMNVLYLGIGREAAMPTITSAGKYSFNAQKANNSEDVLSLLTAMCNLIFGRDILPENHFANNQIDMDISISKLIVFVQGQDVSDVAVTDASGNPVGTLTNENRTHYSEKGAETGKGEVDTSLQGMVMSYKDCPAGVYSLSYSGTASSIEIYYEPDVDFMFTFTDQDGNSVNPNALYEGEYTVSYGMMDSKTGNITDSDLLGKTKYFGSYYINGDEHEISCEEKSGSCAVPLHVGDSFNADMTAEYLSGYRIHKDSSSFGWPDGGLSVSSRPAGNLELSISGGDSLYYLDNLESGSRFCAEIYYEGEKLTGDALGDVELTWDPGLSGAILSAEPCGDCIEIALSHTNPGNPEETPTGDFTVPVAARYSPAASDPSQSAPAEISYSIALRPAGSLELKITGGDSLYHLVSLEEGSSFRAEVYYDGEKLTGDALEGVELTWDANLSGALLTKEFQGDYYDISLSHKDPSDPCATPTGEFTVPITALYQPEVSAAAQSAPVSLTYSIDDYSVAVDAEITAKQTYYQKSRISEGEAVRIDLTKNGLPLSDEDIFTVELCVDCSGIDYETEKLPGESAFLIHLKNTDGLKDGNYVISCDAKTADEVGRTCTDHDEVTLQIMTLPLWLKCLIYVVSGLLLLLIFLGILHIKVLPKASVGRTGSSLSVGGHDVTEDAEFKVRLVNKRLEVEIEYADESVGMQMDVRPGKDSYLSTPAGKRTAAVIPSSVRVKIGDVDSANIIGNQYDYNEETSKMERNPASDKMFTLRHGSQINFSGPMQLYSGRQRYDATIELNFKNKKKK